MEENYWTNYLSNIRHEARLPVGDFNRSLECKFYSNIIRAYMQTLELESSEVDSAFVVATIFASVLANNFNKTISVYSGKVQEISEILRERLITKTVLKEPCSLYAGSEDEKFIRKKLIEKNLLFKDSTFPTMYWPRYSKNGSYLGEFFYAEYFDGGISFRNCKTKDLEYAFSVEELTANF